MPTALRVMNTAKVITSVLLLSFVYWFGFRGMRQVLYFSMHFSFLAWWFLAQALFPARRKIFRNEVSTLVAASILFIVGVVYSLPGFICFAKADNYMTPLQIIGSIITYVIGFALNSSCDFYILGAKSVDPKCRVKEGPFSVFGYPQYIGDWMRYSSMAFVSGHFYSFGVPLFVIMFNSTRIFGKRVEHHTHKSTSPKQSSG